VLNCTLATVEDVMQCDIGVKDEKVHSIVPQGSFASWLGEGQHMAIVHSDRGGKETNRNQCSLCVNDFYLDLIVLNCTLATVEDVMQCDIGVKDEKVHSIVLVRTY
jgi:urease alpha subunit